MSIMHGFVLGRTWVYLLCAINKSDTILTCFVWAEFFSINIVLLRMGAHERLVQLGWKFVRETCGCHGAEKRRIYIRNNDQLIYYTRQNLFSINNEPKKSISEIEAITT